MKALVHTKPYKFNYTDIPDPVAGPEDVVVRVHAVGICGSDVHGYTGQSGRRIPPIVMGHEASGVVHSIGSEVKGFVPGERVCFDSTIYCGQCDACRKGAVNRCIHRQVLGVSIPGMKRQGAMAEYVVLPSWTLVRMPDTLSFEEAAMLEPVSIGLHAVNQATLSFADTVLVVGAGTIGLFVIQAARAQGAGRIVVSDPNPFRRELARQLGADVAIDPDSDDLPNKIGELTDGRGVDVAFEVVGFASTLHQAIRCTATGGKVILVGNLTPNVELNVQEIISRELTLRGSYASSGEYRDAVGLVSSGKIQVQPLISEIRPLSEGQQCFDRLHAGKENLIKIILKP